ncbi:MAG: hypothetical protein V1800_13720 [Candidatus Latescibacterota bacterium]
MVTVNPMRAHLLTAEFEYLRMDAATPDLSHDLWSWLILNYIPNVYNNMHQSGMPSIAVMNHDTLPPYVGYRSRCGTVHIRVICPGDIHPFMPTVTVNVAT